MKINSRTDGRTKDFLMINSVVASDYCPLSRALIKGVTVVVSLNSSLIIV